MKKFLPVQRSIRIAGLLTALSFAFSKYSTGQILFAASDTDQCENFCISFFDLSSNNPTSWQWQFPGATPSSSTVQNPVNICYSVPGSYNVTLTTTSANGTQTLTMYDYITIYPTPPFPNITQIGLTLTSSPANSYQWQFNSFDIFGATNQTYSGIQTGYYTVIITDSNGCYNSTTIFVLVTGVDEVAGEADISIYPNPSSGIFIVGWLNGVMVGEVSIDIVNTLGQKVFSSTEKISSANFKKEIVLSNVANGTYFILIKTKDEFVRKKVLIE